MDPIKNFKKPLQNTTYKNCSIWFRSSDIRFNKRNEAEYVLEALIDLANHYGLITVADFLDIAGPAYDKSCYDYGWPSSLIRALDIRIIGDENKGYYLSLPYPYHIKNRVCEAFGLTTSFCDDSKKSALDSFRETLIRSTGLPAYLINSWDNRIEKEFKEENTMGTNVNNNVFYATYELPKITDAVEETPENIEYEKKCKELRDKAEKKILDIRKELAEALHKLDQERKDAERIAIEKKRAEIWKQKYDAFVEAGFSEEQAWKMMMESYKAD